MIILVASLLILNPLFITLNIAFVSPPPAHVSNAISYLQFQSHSYNHPAAVIIVAERSPARLLSKWTGERGRTDGKEEGTVEGKTTSRLHISTKITTAEDRGAKSCG